MYQKLKKHYPSLIVYDNNIPTKLSKNYRWFTSDDHHVLGIKKDELNKKEQDIISAFLTPYQSTIPLPTELEIKWKECIDSNKWDDTLKKEFRFIYFSFQSQNLKPKVFKKAIRPFFTSIPPILWESASMGIIIEQQGMELQSSLSYQQIADTLLGELFVEVRFLIGPYVESGENVTQHYSSLIESAKVIEIYSKKAVQTYKEVIPILLVEKLSNEDRETISRYILKDLRNDKEMIHTIKTFIQSGLNISLTAKKLYIHRNSLQYRIDKFIQQTGLDVRNMEEALTVYIAILTMMNKKIE